MTPAPDAPRPLVGRPELDALTAAAFLAAVGVMLALCASVPLWPLPADFTGVHAHILDSSTQQLRLEPREKGFLALAAAAGFCAAFLALALRRPRITCSWRTCALLAVVVLVVNFASGLVLNYATGMRLVLAALGVVLALTYAAVRASR
jgi:hypothetical protein